MDPFGQLLSSNVLTLWAWVFAATLLTLVQIGKAVRHGLITTALIAIAGVFVAIIAGTLGVVMFALWFNPSQLLPAVAKDPAAMIAYFTELGVEFSLVGILSILIFCFMRGSGRRAARL